MAGLGGEGLLKKASKSWPGLLHDGNSMTGSAPVQQESDGMAQPPPSFFHKRR